MVGNPRRNACIGPLVLVLAAAACDGDARPEEPARPPSVEVMDSAGIQLVLNGPEGVWGSGSGTVEEVLRIGVAEGDERHQFYQVTDVDRDPEGRVYVANGTTATIRVFDDEGRFVREFGGQGQGPGEFVRLDRIYMSENGPWIGDSSLLRVTAFDFRGRPVDGWTFIADGILYLSHRTPQGWLGVAYQEVRPRPERPPVGTAHTTRVFVHRIEAGSGVDAGGSPEPLIELPPRILYAVEDGSAWDWPLFLPRAYTGVDAAGRIHVSPGDPYQVDVFSPDGTLLRRIRRDVAPVLLEPEVAASELVGYAREFLLGEEYGGSRDSALRQIREYAERVEWQASLPTGTRVPPVGRLLVSPDGSFWLERTDAIPAALREFWRTFPNGREAIGGQEPGLWDLFDADGRFLGQVQLPPRFVPYRADGFTVLGIERDEVGLEYVVLYRVVTA